MTKEILADDFRKKFTNDINAEDAAEKGFIAGWEARERWIPINEKLPGEHEKVVVMLSDENVLMGVMGTNEHWAIFWSDGLNDLDYERPVTHWMPLPEPLKQSPK